MRAELLKPGWQRNLLAVSLLLVTIWGGLKWAEKQFSRLNYKWDADPRWVGGECAGYEFHQYRAFSLRDIAFYLVPSGIGDRDHPIFVRIVEKKAGRAIGETGVYWMLTSPEIFCPEEDPKQIKIYLGKGSADEHLETFDVSPP